MIEVRARFSKENSAESEKKREGVCVAENLQGIALGIEESE